MGYFPVSYDYRVVIYECKMFIRLATGWVGLDTLYPDPRVQGGQKRARWGSGASAMHLMIFKQIWLLSFMNCLY